MYPGIHYIHHTYIYNTQDAYAMCLGEFVKKKSKKKNIKGLETCVSSPLGGRVKKKKLPEMHLYDASRHYPHPCCYDLAGFQWKTKSVIRCSGFTLSPWSAFVQSRGC